MKRHIREDVALFSSAYRAGYRMLFSKIKIKPHLPLLSPLCFCR
jgi:hypothetical protein